MTRVLKPSEAARDRRCFEIEFSTHVDARGRLTIIEGRQHLPFAIERIYYLTDIAPGSTRGAHAHRKLEQVMVALTGSLDVHLSDGRSEWTHRLARSDIGLYMAPYIWHEIKNFSRGAICLMLASMPYDESDYIRNYEQFCSLVNGAQ